MDHHLVTKSNKVIEATYKLSLTEQRVILSCISKHDSREAINKGKDFNLSAKEYSDLFNIDIKNAYIEIKEASDNLFERYLWITNPSTGNPVKTRWVSSIEYLDGSINLHFAKKITPFLESLSSEFTSYRLGNITRLTSTYAIRLYEMFAQWKNRGELIISVENLRKRLGVEDGEYKRMDHFKSRVIKIGIDQINKHSDIKCNYDQIKSGKKITAFKFYFGENCPTQIELEEAIASIPQ